VATALQFGAEITVDQRHVPLAMATIFTGVLTRAATMTALKVMIGYAFIPGVYYHPDNLRDESAAIDSPMRYA
jgi:hypothetical protein